MKPILVSSGEPAGIGPDLCLALAAYGLPVVILADKSLLIERAVKLKLTLDFSDYQVDKPLCIQPNHLTVLSLPCTSEVVAGQLNPLNASYVVKLLSSAAEKCLQGEFSALVTAPVNKAVINQAGIAFTGHTEFFAQYCQVDTVVMLLSCDVMKVALVTTHLPLRAVPDAITRSQLESVLRCLDKALRHDFNLTNPCIYVAGLNPHAGEGGYLGREEIEIITPVLTELKAQGLNIQGPFPADTLFTPQHLHHCDVFVAMYHDQGLAVLKYAGFGSAVNITLGLPFIRTSVDHGTALDLAGTGRAEISSMLAAVRMAQLMATIKATA